MLDKQLSEETKLKLAFAEKFENTKTQLSECQKEVESLKHQLKQTILKSEYDYLQEELNIVKSLRADLEGVSTYLFMKLSV